MAAALEPALQQAFEREGKRLIEDSTYTARGHQQAGVRWETYEHWLGLPTAIGSALLAGGAGISAITDRHPWSTAILAFAAAIASAAHGFLRPGIRANEHALKGNRFIALRNDARIFYEIELHSDTPVDKLKAQLRELRKRYADLNETPPLRIPPKDYEAAKASIAAGESSYEDDRVWKELSN